MPYTAKEFVEGADWLKYEADREERVGNPFFAAQLRNIAKGLHQAAETQEELIKERQRSAKLLADSNEVSKQFNAKWHELDTLTGKVKELREWLEACTIGTAHTLDKMDALGLALTGSPETPKET